MKWHILREEDRKPSCFSAGTIAVPFAEWQLFKGVRGRFIRERRVLGNGDINALGTGRIEVTPVEIRTAIPCGDKSCRGSRKPRCLSLS
ncbi:MAG: hypothetical protein ACE5OZ_12155 [Candidatus Heimdallarchaeota archaeon]